MAGKIKKRRKKAKRKARKANSFGNALFRVFIGLSILLFLVIFAGLAVHHMLLRKQPVDTKPPITDRVIRDNTPTPQRVPRFEVFPKDDRRPAHPPRIAVQKPDTDGRPRVSIIIDDLGYDRKMAKKFIDLDPSLTFSILPLSPHTRDIALAAQASGSETMLHLPMEPMEYPKVDPGPGALLTEMNPDQLIRQLKKDLDLLPGIKGVNNHMGSRMTQVSSQMRQIFSILKNRDLYFVDSRSTAETVARSSARLFKLPFAERDVFIDHYQKPEFIRKQLKELVKIARKEGKAIGIAHPYGTTYEILRQELPELKKQIHLVPVSRVIDPVG